MINQTEEKREKRDPFTEEVRAIRKIIEDDPEYIRLDEEALRERARTVMEMRIEQSHSEPETARYKASLDYKSRRQLINSVYESIRGLGILGKIITDKSITEIMINGWDTIFVERNGHLERIQETFESKENLRDIITKFVQDMGRSVTDSDPIVDTRLEDGSRVNVVLNPIALDGPAVTIRRFPEEGMTVRRLIGYGSLTEEAAEFLERLVKAKYNIFIAGGTGSGKTTFLNALSNFIPQDERVISIEDSAELQIKHIPNLVRLETRNANSTGAGAITMRDLIKSSLRMRPERIIVGEVRGAEALDMLQAMNTGHDGSISTGHANSAEDMISRLETMVLQGAAGLPLEAIRQQIASAVDIIIHLSRMRDGSRKTLAISEVKELAENGRVILNPLYKFVDEDPTSHKVRGRLHRTHNPMAHPEKFLSAGIVDYIADPDPDDMWVRPEGKKEDK
ncbi:MAG: CpaF family protein [Clostridia bacterium]|nr:CpaF family protein [Clostridia bacterium]